MTVRTPAPASTARWLGWLGLLMIGLIAGVVLCAGAMIAMRWPTQQTLYTDRQPGTVAYDDDSSHVIAIIRYRSLLEDSYRLYAGRDPSLSYGHFVDVDFASIADKPVQSTQWTPEGVRVRFGTGHELFVPAASFIGGR
ncbi:hypothetical protein HII36_34475 [Nonomuraea sp. NN258]|uniref:hypothetical protein n=1 Tax=Nonomuraea antri TaxID=2730852 RepID=UPI0015688E59|nr:hypothetical protein [Nonomuraea antri]NRQ36907.1 hypothetical protein [Nonomuraea antri]